MKRAYGMMGVIVGVIVGAACGLVLYGQVKPAYAANDRFEDYVMTTGPVSVNWTGPALDGVWLLDYKSGKLLGSVVNRVTGKVAGWAEVDLVNEFNLVPRGNVHFLMTTGNVANGLAALYVAETSSGKFGVYTMTVAEGPGASYQIFIRRYDMVSFRNFKRIDAPQVNN
jgi:hypothetical protein